MTETAPPLDPAPKQKKKESWWSIALVAGFCGLFLWWWFSLPPIVEPVGSFALVERALQEAEVAEPGSSQAPLLQLDLFELAMLQLRKHGVEKALPFYEKISLPALRDRWWREAALSTFNQNSGDFAVSLKRCENIQDAAAKQRAKDDCIVEMGLLGMTDGSLALAGGKPELLARLARTFVESGRAEEAQPLVAGLRQIPLLENTALADLTWAQLGLRDWEFVEAVLTRLPQPQQDELWQDYFRATRLEHPEKAAALYAKLPARLHFQLRLEAAAQLSGPFPPEPFLTELKAAADATAPNSPEAAEKLLALAKAAWQLQSSKVGKWQDFAELAMNAAEPLPPGFRATLAAEVAAIFLEAAEIERGRTHLDLAITQAIKVPDTAERFTVLTKIHEQAFRSSEPDHAAYVITSLQSTLEAHTTAAASDQAKNQPPLNVKPLLNALFRGGLWKEAVQLMQAEAKPEISASYLEEILSRIVEATAIQDLLISQDKSMERHRVLAANQGEANATVSILRMSKGPERARAWLAVAKAL